VRPAIEIAAMEITKSTSVDSDFPSAKADIVISLAAILIARRLPPRALTEGFSDGSEAFRVQ
jgi:hypothetical protein